MTEELAALERAFEGDQPPGGESPDRR